ncbi:MAG: AbrB/MazE/SpoVT family DNA-binding domain-containing protein [Phycisphaerales bacterium]|jgi:antitoxin component of MazEF toxin-antitoxin module|nr:AbrB/MazE/SpoVT family DNA-binding domain-containing protein [Phycisphaerales bacterium]
MIKTLTKHGNSYALIIDKPIMELLHFRVDSKLELMIVEDALVIKRAEMTRQERIAKAAKEINEQYGDAFRRLAE